MNLLLLGSLVQIADIVLGVVSKNPATAPQFGPLMGKLVGVMSQAAGETPEQTAKRLADHDALVAQYGTAAPPSR